MTTDSDTTDSSTDKRDYQEDVPDDVIDAREREKEVFDGPIPLRSTDEFLDEYAKAGDAEAAEKLLERGEREKEATAGEGAEAFKDAYPDAPEWAVVLFQKMERLEAQRAEDEKAKPYEVWGL